MSRIRDYRLRRPFSYSPLIAVYQQSAQPVEQRNFLRSALGRDQERYAEYIESRGAGWYKALGWRIVSACAHMTQDEMGIYGATRAIFPLWIAINMPPAAVRRTGKLRDSTTQMVGESQNHATRSNTLVEMVSPASG